MNVLDWKTKKINRVCRSIKTAEAVSAEENSGRGANFGIMLREIMTGHKQREQKQKMKFEDMKCADVEIYLDNESTHCNIYSDKNPIEQGLIYDIRRIQQLLRDKEIRKVHILDTKEQLADPFTKSMKASESFIRAIYGGSLEISCRCCYRKSSCNNTSLSGIVETDDLEYQTGPESGDENQEWVECLSDYST